MNSTLIMCNDFFEAVSQYVDSMWFVDERVWLVRMLFAV